MMDEPDIVGDVEDMKSSAKMTSRRKKSRPVKFNQDVTLASSTEDTSHCSSDQSSGNVVNTPPSFETDIQNPASWSNHQVSKLPPALCHPQDVAVSSEIDQVQGTTLSPQALTDMIKRQVTSIRDADVTRPSSSKKQKIDHRPAEMPNANEESSTTFSSLLHNFASQVNSSAESGERRSPYSQKTPGNDAIWPVQNASPSVLSPREQTPRPSAEIGQSRETGQKRLSTDISFSGLLQNFVSCVNDTSGQESSHHSRLTTNIHASADEVAIGNKPVQNYSVNRTHTDVQTNDSFAGLLHNFASAVDKGGQDQSNPQAIWKKFRQVQMGQQIQIKEQPRTTAKSLLDVLHDTISHSVLGTTPKSHYNVSKEAVNENGVPQVKDTPQDIYSSSRFTLDRVIKTEPQDVDWLPYDNQQEGEAPQWNELRGIIPDMGSDDLDRENLLPEESGAADKTDRPIKEEPCDDDYERPLNDGPDSFSEGDAYNQLCSPSESPDKISNSPQTPRINNSIVIKQEPMDEQIEMNPSLQFVSPEEEESSETGIHTERFNSQSKEVPKSSENDLPSPFLSHNKDDDVAGSSQSDGDGSCHTDEVGQSDEGKQRNQAGLVSHLLNTGDSSHWRSQNNGSFADFLHNIASNVIDKCIPDGEDNQTGNQMNPKAKQEININDAQQQTDVQKMPMVKIEPPDETEPVSIVDNPRGRKKGSGSPAKQNLPRCVTRLLDGSASKSVIPEQFSADASSREMTMRKVKKVVYAELTDDSTPDDTDSQEEDINVLGLKAQGKVMHNSLPSSKRSPMKHGWRRGPRHGMKLKQGWPKRRDDIHKHIESRKPATHGRNVITTTSAVNISRQDPTPDTMSFTDILQKIAKQCEGANQQHVIQRSPNSSVVTIQPPSNLQSSRPQPRAGTLSEEHSTSTDVQNSKNLRNLLVQERSLPQYHQNAVATSETPSSSVQSPNVSFANLMQNMASNVSSNKASSAQVQYEDLTTLEPPSPWIKSQANNWLRFMLLSLDENPKIVTSVSINLWNKIHELKIHCHHMEVPVNHWIFRRFGKRLHTKAALFGVLQAISSGCTVCEGTTRSDLVQMYRNKLSTTSRWQANSVLEDSFGPITIRSKECELLVSGLRRSRERRCARCSKFVDRKLKAVMYHLRKKLGLS